MLAIGRGHSPAGQGWVRSGGLALNVMATSGCRGLDSTPRRHSATTAVCRAQFPNREASGRLLALERQLQLFNVEREVQGYLDGLLSCVLAVVYIDISLELITVADDLLTALCKRLHEVVAGSLVIVHVGPERHRLVANLGPHGMLCPVALAALVGAVLLSEELRDVRRDRIDDRSNTRLVQPSLVRPHGHSMRVEQPVVAKLHLVAFDI